LIGGPVRQRVSSLKSGFTGFFFLKFPVMLGAYNTHLIRTGPHQ
jgi:hypothetical protein